MCVCMWQENARRIFNGLLKITQEIAWVPRIPDGDKNGFICLLFYKCNLKTVEQHLTLKTVTQGSFHSNNTTIESNAMNGFMKLQGEYQFMKLKISMQEN